MGTINFISSTEMPFPSCSRHIGDRSAYFKQIYVRNWRLVCEIIESKTLFVITHNYRTFEIEGITLDDFFDNNDKKGSIERPFRYHSTTISCIGCHGSGKVDWIGKIMKRDADRPDYSLKFYVRDPHCVNSFQGPPFFKGIDTIYGSVPHLSDGFEICHRCKGTGLHSMNESILYE